MYYMYLVLLAPIAIRDARARAIYFLRLASLWVGTHQKTKRKVGMSAIAYQKGRRRVPLSPKNRLINIQKKAMYDPFHVLLSGQWPLTFFPSWCSLYHRGVTRRLFLSLSLRGQTLPNSSYHSPILLPLLLPSSATSF